MSTPSLESWRTGPLYTIREASRLAGVSSQTVERWMNGYQSSGKFMAPVFGSPIDSPVVSFLQLAETVTVSKFRKNRVPLERIRAAHEFARSQIGIDYPFASLKLEAFARHLALIPHDSNPWSSLAVVDTSGVWTLPGIVIELLHERFEYKNDLASRWFPLGKNVPIVVDPRYAAGVPTIPDRGVTIENITKRFKAGQSIRFIAKDLSLQRQQVEEVIRFADNIAA